MFIGRVSEMNELEQRWQRRQFEFGVVYGTRRIGKTTLLQEFVKGKNFGKLAEGVYTVTALMDIAREYHLELPICATVNAIINEGKSPQEELLKLFLRDKKSEQE